MVSFFVSEYTRFREYGGPEEGGWYYDVLSHHRVIAEFSIEGGEVGDALLGITHEMARKLAAESPVLFKKHVEDREARHKESALANLDQLGDDESVDSCNPEGHIPRGWRDWNSKTFFLVEEYPGQKDTTKAAKPVYS